MFWLTDGHWIHKKIGNRLITWLTIITGESRIDRTISQTSDRSRIDRMISLTSDRQNWQDDQSDKWQEQNWQDDQSDKWQAELTGRSVWQVTGAELTGWSVWQVTGRIDRTESQKTGRSTCLMGNIRRTNYSCNIIMVHITSFSIYTIHKVFPRNGVDRRDNRTTGSCKVDQTESLTTDRSTSHTGNILQNQHLL